MRMVEVPKDFPRNLSREVRGKLKKYTIRPDPSPYRDMSPSTMDEANHHFPLTESHTTLKIYLSRDSQSVLSTADLLPILETEDIQPAGLDYPDLALPLFFCPTPDCLYPPGCRKERRERGRMEREKEEEDISERDLKRMIKSFQTHSQTERCGVFQRFYKTMEGEREEIVF